MIEPIKNQTKPTILMQDITSETVAWSRRRQRRAARFAKI